MTETIKYWPNPSKKILIFTHNYILTYFLFICFRMEKIQNTISCDNSNRHNGNPKPWQFWNWVCDGLYDQFHDDCHKILNLAQLSKLITFYNRSKFSNIYFNIMTNMDISKSISNCCLNEPKFIHKTKS